MAHRHLNSGRTPLAAVLVLALVCAAAARAQELNPLSPDQPQDQGTAPPPGEYPAPSPAAPAQPLPFTEAMAEPAPGYEPTGRNPTYVISQNSNSGLQEMNATQAQPVSPFQWGPVTFDPHPSYSLFYTDGILAAPGKSASTTRQSFSPGFAFELGPNWSLDYTPTWEDYSNKLFHDGFDQAARLMGAARVEDWNLQFSQNYSRTYDPLIETGEQTREDAYDTAFKAVYNYGGRPLLELGVDQDIELSPISPDAYDWSTLDWLHHPLGPNWDVAIGGGFAYTVMRPGFDMTAVRPEAQISWQSTRKLSFDLQGGWEDRKFVGSTGSALDTPIYTGTAAYQVTEATAFTASATRDVEPGYSLNQVDDVAQYAVGIRQRLLHHFYFAAQAGAERIGYIQAGFGSPRNVREDNAANYQASLNTVVLRHISLGIQVSKVRDDSNAAGFNFDSNQYGFTAQIRY